MWWLRTPRSNIASHCTSGYSQKGASNSPVNVSWPPQALFTSTSSRPSSRPTHAKISATCASCVWSHRDVAPVRVTSSAVSSMLPDSAESSARARFSPYVIAGSVRVLRPVT